MLAVYSGGTLWIVGAGGGRMQERRNGGVYMGVVPTHGTRHTEEYCDRQLDPQRNSAHSLLEKCI